MKQLRTRRPFCLEVTPDATLADVPEAALEDVVESAFILASLIFALVGSAIVDD